jgi:hypothetical protein
MSDPLHRDAFVVPSKPIVGLIAPMGDEEATWPVTDDDPAAILDDTNGYIRDKNQSLSEAARPRSWSKKKIGFEQGQGARS